MTNSMTGYGEAARENERIRVGFRIKTVNHKGLDINLRLPFDFMYMEGDLRNIVKDRLHRGRVDIFAELEIRDPDAMPPTPLNHSRMAQLMGLVKEIQDTYPITGELDINTMIRLQDLTTNQRVGFRLPEDLETLVREAISDAVAQLETSRSNEGRALIAFINEALDQLIKDTESIAAIAVTRREEIEAGIRQKVAQLKEEADIDESRLATEVVYYADRLDITEEIQRLSTHQKTMARHLKSGKKPLGKRLEFLLQEQLREVTTIGNKAKHQEIADLVVKLKTEYEKIREQVLNIE